MGLFLIDLLPGGYFLLKAGDFFGGPGRIGFPALRPLDLNAQLFEVVVDIPDILLFDGVDIIQRRLRPGVEFEEFWPGLVKALGDDFAVLPHRGEKAKKRTPFIPFQINHLLGKRMPGHQAVIHPAKIGAVQVTVGDLELRPVVFPDVSGLLRNSLLSTDRPQELLSVLKVNGSELIGPEEPERIGPNDPD